MDEPTLHPKQLPSTTHVVVVALETIHVPMPDSVVTPGFTNELLIYRYTSPALHDVPARVACASIITTTTCPINARTLGEAPYLKCVITQTTGTDHIDLDECRRRGIRVLNSPGVTKEAVSQHAMSLYFATRRRIVAMHNAMLDFEDGRPNYWRAQGSLSSRLKTADNQAPPSCDQEVVGMIGYGVIGRYIAKMCRALGMEVIVAARKNADAESLPNGHHNNSNGAAADPPRLPFDEVLRRSTVLMLALPLSPSSTNLISTAEFKLMHPSAVLVNISRGGIVDEPALLAALREGRVYGYGTDVFAREPAGSDADSVLLSAEARGLNLALTPHLAWLGDLTMVNIQTAARENIKNFVAGTDVNVIA